MELEGEPVPDSPMSFRAKIGAHWFKVDVSRVHGLPSVRLLIFEREHSSPSQVAVFRMPERGPSRTGCWRSDYFPSSMHEEFNSSYARYLHRQLVVPSENDNPTDVDVSNLFSFSGTVSSGTVSSDNLTCLRRVI